MAAEFWLSDDQWAAIEPLLPRNQPGLEGDNDRRVISGIVPVLKIGCRYAKDHRQRHRARRSRKREKPCRRRRRF